MNYIINGAKNEKKIYLHSMQFYLKPDVFWWSFVMWQIGRIQHHFLKWDLKAPDINYMLNINSCLYSRYLGFIFILTHLFIVSLSLPYKLNQWRTLWPKPKEEIPTNLFRFETRGLPTVVSYTEHRCFWILVKLGNGFNARTTPTQGVLNNFHNRLRLVFNFS